MRARARKRSIKRRKARKAAKTRKQRGGSYHIAKIIWGYWDNPNIPPAMMRFFDRRKSILTGWEHRILNKDNLHEFIDLSTFPKKFGSLATPHQADWIRLAVLEKHGGCWMDAAIFVNKADALEDLYKESVATKAEMAAFYCEHMAKGKGPEAYIENWFIMAPMHSKLITEWKREFEHAIDIGFKHYKKEVFNHMDAEQIYPKPDDTLDNYHWRTYLTMHACILMVLRRYKPNMILKRAEDSMYKIHADLCKWEEKCSVVEKIQQNMALVKEIPYFKISSREILNGADFSAYFEGQH
jgi:hypothetical protein